MEERYIRNFDALSESEFELIRRGRVLVAGCGGLGGYAVELLARLGVGALTAVDGDVFEPGNLNRQLLADVTALGKSKAEAAAERVRAINPTVEVRAAGEYVTAENAEALVEGHDLVIDALDSVEARLVLSDACEKLGVPFVHGAVCGWNAQVCTVLPGSGAMRKIYSRGAEENKTILSFTPAFCAGIQVSEAARILAGQPPLLAGRLLLADLRYMEIMTVEI